MAAAPPAPLASSVEKTNGAKLSRLLIDGSTTVLRNIFDRYHPPKNLAANLNANYLTLNNLLRRRVFRTAQWDQLFPPGGATPDSKTFDITLLFLLLTNICGLTPPFSGWHAKPSPSDISLEANLARVKFFRNELYGHVTTTGVDTPTFNALWLEISAVLVALGLDQAEIDRLKAEHCGEEHYLDVLLDWTDNEQDIKSQLKSIHQCQTETQQDLEKILEKQAQDHNTLANTISKLDQVHQIENKTHEAVKEARQTQLEDHETLHDTILKLDEIHQIESETHQAIKDAGQTQKETRQAVEEVHETLQEVKQEIENMKRKREMDRADKLLKNLAKSEFKGDIEYHAQRFQEGTREWIFKRIDDWLNDRNSPNRVMVICGAAGMGKSVISAVICKRMQDAGRLSGSHFCQHNNVRYRNPRLMLQSLACHLSHAIPEYKNALVEQLSRNLGPVELNSMGVEELFALLFKEPLSKIPDPGRNILMVIDGLDESEYQGRNELLDVIANQFCKLPQWIRFFVTTRTEINIAESLKHLQPIQLEENKEDNLRDIQLFFEMQLTHKIEEERKDVLLLKLVEKSEGVFLYAYFLIDYIQKNVLLLTPEQLESSFPLSISSVYRFHFKRLENELCKELKIEEDQILNFLCALTASREPLPVAFVSRLLNLSGGPLSVQRKINKAIASISSLLPVRNDCLHFFHKSVKDWLCYGRHDFTVDKKEGHKILFNICRNELDNIKQKGVHDTNFSDTERYALKHGVQHMIEVGKLDELSTYVTDVELIYAKLCVNTASCLEEVFSVQMEVAMTDQADQALINSLYLLLRRHSYLLRDNPHLFFQCVLNEGEPELSSRAAAVLETKLSHIPYMNYLEQEEQLGTVEARFYCSDTIACFDVSPQMNYMVCECRDGTLHLWSLQNGNREWVRSSFVKKEFYGCYPLGSAYRELKKSLSFYQSVVFHPSGNFVLPGSLSSVYTLRGDSNFLFQKSACTFSNCIFSGDRKFLLTDSPNNSKVMALWSMENGDELKRIIWNEDISCFAISQDASVIAFSDFAGLISLWFGKDERVCVLSKCDLVCGLMHFPPNTDTLVCGFLHLHSNSAFGYEFGGVASFIFVTPPSDVPISSRPQVTPARAIFFWPCPSGNPTESDFLGQTGPACWFKEVQSVIPYVSTGLYFMLNNGKVLIGSPTLRFLSMLNIALLNKEEMNSATPGEECKVKQILFSQKGDIVYCILGSERVEETRVAVFDRESGEVINRKTFAPRKVMHLSIPCKVSLIPIKEGIVLFSSPEVPELWNFNLTEYIRPFSGLMQIDELIPVSDELIACQRFMSEGHVTIDIVNTTSGDLISSVKAKVPEEPFPVISICCSSRQQVLMSTEQMKMLPTLYDFVIVTVSLWDTDSSLIWEKSSKCFIVLGNYGQISFSPEEEFVVTWNCLDEGNGVHILDAKTGEIRHRFLQSQNDIVDCKFVNCEVLVCCSKDNFLRLFNIRTGDLLSVLDIKERPYCLGVCLDKSLVAIGLSCSRLKFIHVKLPSATAAEDKKG